MTVWSRRLLSADSNNVWEDGVGHHLNAISSSLPKASGERVHLDANAGLCRSRAVHFCHQLSIHSRSYLGSAISIHYLLCKCHLALPSTNTATIPRNFHFTKNKLDPFNYLQTIDNKREKQYRTQRSTENQRQDDFQESHHLHHPPCLYPLRFCLLGCHRLRRQPCYSC
jgi:hypothetical protein